MTRTLRSATEPHFLTGRGLLIVSRSDKARRDRLQAATQSARASELSMLIARSVQRLAMSKNISRCAPGGIASAVCNAFGCVFSANLRIEHGPFLQEVGQGGVAIDR